MWSYKDKKITEIKDFPKGTVGFVYIIRNLSNNKFYIGKKVITNAKTVKISRKKQAQQTARGRKKIKETVFKESDWAVYFGSSKVLLEDLKTLGESQFKREILKICYSKKQLTYWEIYYQMTYGVLHASIPSYNESIQGRFFKKDLLEPAK